MFQDLITTGSPIVVTKEKFSEHGIPDLKVETFHPLINSFLNGISLNFAFES